MRHRLSGRALGRSSSHRQALIRNQITDLLRHERIVTTEAKAKTLRPAAEKVITLGKRGTLHARRQAAATLTDRRVVRRLFDDIAPRFASRRGGYTRIVKLGPRKGDGARMALIELVDGAPPSRTRARPADEPAVTTTAGVAAAEDEATATDVAEEDVAAEAVEDTDAGEEAEAAVADADDSGVEDDGAEAETTDDADDASADDEKEGS